jgi:outer membrane protein
MTAMPRLRTLLAGAITVALLPFAQASDLSTAYRQAVERDPQLKIAASSRDAAQEGIRLARARLLPQLTGSAELSRSNSDAQRTQPFQSGDSFVLRQVPLETETDGRSYGIQLNQTIYDHANYTQLQAARSNAARAEAQYQAVLQQLAVRVAEAYFAMLTAEDSVRFARADEKAVTRQLDQAEQRFNVGLTAITDVHEARARRDSATAAAILAENALDDAREALAEITGNFVEAVKPLRENIPLEPPSPNVWQDWVKLAMDGNPELRAALLASEAADFQIATARAGHYPTVSAFVSYTDSEDDTDTTILGTTTSNNSPFKNDTIGIRLSVPIFSGFAVSSRVRQSVAEHQGSLEQQEQTRRTVTRQTRNAFRAILAGISEVKARQQALVSAQSALDATQAGFEVGTRTIVDLLISQQVLVQAQRDYSRARHDFVVNGLRLKRAAGIIGESDIEAINALLEERPAA